MRRASLLLFFLPGPLSLAVAGPFVAAQAPPVQTPAGAKAAAPALKVPPKIVVEPGEWAVIDVETAGKTVVFHPVDPGLKQFPPHLLASQKTAVFGTSGVKPGSTIRVLVYSAVEGEPTLPAVCVVMVGTSPPPEPTPDPVPPKPDDPPEPKPTSALRVMLVRETSARLTREQAAIFNSTKIRAYLNAKCVQEDGRPGWREYDPQQDTTNETATWQQLWNAARPSMPKVPALVIFDGMKGQWHELPATEAETLALLAKAGGE